MVARIIFAALLFFPLTGFAAEKGKPTAADLCRRLTHVQNSTEADYVPGKDAYGRDVAPADLAEDAAPPISLPDTLTVHLGTNDFQQLNLPDTGAAYTPYMNLGEITVRKDGSVYFNGQRLTQPQVQGLCKGK